MLAFDLVDSQESVVTNCAHSDTKRQRCWQKKYKGLGQYGRSKRLAQIGLTVTGIFHVTRKQTYHSLACTNQYYLRTPWKTAHNHSKLDSTNQLCSQNVNHNSNGFRCHGSRRESNTSTTWNPPLWKSSLQLQDNNHMCLLSYLTSNTICQLLEICPSISKSWTKG